MSENEASPDAEKSAGEEDIQKKKKKKLIIMGGAGALVLVIIGAGLFFTSGKSGNSASTQTDHAKEPAANASAAKIPKIIYYNLDEFIVNLSKVGGQPSFLKMAITLEIVDESSVDKIVQKMPVIRDTFQVYLRELRAEDLQGSAGIYRLREELLLRLNKLMYPTKINDILFREILVQ